MKQMHGSQNDFNDISPKTSFRPEQFGVGGTTRVIDASLMGLGQLPPSPIDLPNLYARHSVFKLRTERFAAEIAPILAC